MADLKHTTKKQLQLDLAEAQKRIGEWQGLYNSIFNQRIEMLNRLDGLKNLHMKLNKEHDECGKTIEVLRADITTLTEANADLRSEIRSKERRVAKLQNENNMLHISKEKAVTAMHEQAAAMGLMARNWPVPQVLSATEDELPF